MRHHKHYKAGPFITSDRLHATLSRILFRDTDLDY